MFLLQTGSGDTDVHITVLQASILSNSLSDKWTLLVLKWSDLAVYKRTIRFLFLSVYL